MYKRQVLRVRGRRKVSGAVRRDEDYVSFYQPTFPNEWIIKQVYASAMSGVSPVVVMPTEQAGNYISAYFYEPKLDVSYEGGLGTNATLRYRKLA